MNFLSIAKMVSNLKTKTAADIAARVARTDLAPQEKAAMIRGFSAVQVSGNSMAIIGPSEEHWA
ncbi:MAG: hypothetical protein LBT22_02965 [Peptococcaceae bacterium]|jgi:hypothetical protein|nr:hypothetical protein [Peptococcaceae bacterium]